MIRCEQLYTALESLTKLLSRHGIGVPAAFVDNFISKNDGGMHSTLHSRTHESLTGVRAIEYSKAPEMKSKDGRAADTSTAHAKFYTAADNVVDDLQTAKDALSDRQYTENQETDLPWLKTNRAVTMYDCDDNRMCEVDLIAAGMEFVLR